MIVAIAERKYWHFSYYRLSWERYFFTKLWLHQKKQKIRLKRRKKNLFLQKISFQRSWEKHLTTGTPEYLSKMSSPLSSEKPKKSWVISEKNSGYWIVPEQNRRMFWVRGMIRAWKKSNASWRIQKKSANSSWKSTRYFRDRILRNELQSKTKKRAKRSWHFSNQFSISMNPRSFWVREISSYMMMFEEKYISENQIKGRTKSSLQIGISKSRGDRYCRKIMQILILKHEHPEHHSEHDSENSSTKMDRPTQEQILVEEPYTISFSISG